MNVSPQGQAVILLTVPFGKTDAKPLSVREWARLALWLKDHELEPSRLLKGDPKSLLSSWMDRTVTPERVEGLLDRGGALGLALEKWQRTGLWIITRSEADYPERLKRKLRLDSPPVLFGCGNRALLNKGGIAVVGSRDADEDDLSFSTSLARTAAYQGLSVVSGAARGVDESAMLGALENEGTAVGVMADSLLRAATSAKYRKHLLAGDLVLVSPFNPEVGFNVGNAMARNKYIYCLSDAAVVVNSTPDKGGTWNGAVENLKNAWVPLWVRRYDSSRSGNPALAQMGAHWLPHIIPSMFDLQEQMPIAGATKNSSDPSLLGGEVAHLLFEDVGRPATTVDNSRATSFQNPSADSVNADRKIGNNTPEPNIALYALFLTLLRQMTSRVPLKIADIANRLQLQKSQVNAWLKRGVSEGHIDEFSRPKRYQSAAEAQKQTSLFGDER
jgi:predicted Rossmann fold nucleotide-binding protein DprA/Smf involved in DNA uptake